MPLEIELAVRHGPLTIRATGESPKEVVRAVAAFQDLPTNCPRCGAPLRFTYRTAAKYAYYGLACNGETPHFVDLGQYQDDERELFYDHKKEWHTRAEIQDAISQRGA